MEQQMQAQSKQLQRRAQEDLQQVRSKQLQDFRREIGPVIMKLQATYGFTIVLDPTMSGGIVFVDPATDITDAVVQELQRQSQDTTVNDPAGTASEMPTGFPGGSPVAP
jgi:Skp family chaperone for outer membrane proteins